MSIMLNEAIEKMDPDIFREYVKKRFRSGLIADMLLLPEPKKAAVFELIRKVTPWELD